MMLTMTTLNEALQFIHKQGLHSQFIKKQQEICKMSGHQRSKIFNLELTNIIFSMFVNMTELFFHRPRNLVSYNYAVCWLRSRERFSPDPAPVPKLRIRNFMFFYVARGLCGRCSRWEDYHVKQVKHIHRCLSLHSPPLSRGTLRDQFLALRDQF